MKKYAMVLLKSVISIVDAENEPFYPPDQHGNIVTAILCDDSVKVGMVYDEVNGKYSEYVPSEPEPTMEEKIYVAVSKTQDEVRQEGADLLMEELMKRGVLK